MNSPTAPQHVDLAPVVLFAFNRSDHLRATLDALKANTQAGASTLYIYADGARGPEDDAGVSAVRQLARNTTGFKQVTLIERPINMGLAQNIIAGVTEVCERFGRVIVLEDDLVTSPYFLQYMNEALALYADDERVASIHGYVYPVQTKLPDTFFLRGADCWGWATWRRAWRQFNPDGQALYNRLIASKQEALFNFGDNYNYMEMLLAQTQGRNNSWAIRWYASAFLNEAYTLYPGRSLVHNIGNDNSGTHSDQTSAYDVHLSNEAIPVTRQVIEDSALGRLAFSKFMGQNTKISIKRRLKARLKYTKLRLRALYKAGRNRRKFKAVCTVNNLWLSGPHSDWATCQTLSTGYDQGAILDRVKAATLKVKQGYAAFERDSVNFNRIEYSWPVLAGLFMAASQSGNSLRVLDFGGSLGSSYFQNRDALRHLPDIRWGVVEQAQFVRCGEECIADDVLTFHDSITLCDQAIAPNVALVSSVLQYLPDPWSILAELNKSSIAVLIIDRTPFTNAMQDQFLVQHVPESIYKASYPIRVFSRRQFEIQMSSNWQLLSEFDALDHIPSMTDAKWEGRIYVRK